MKDLRFIARYGFTTMDQISFGIDELEKALYMHKYGVSGILNGKQLSGKYIIVVEEDIHYYTGWNRSYSPKTGEDFAQIERDCPKGMKKMIENTKKKIDYLINTKQTHLIGKNVVIPELEAQGEIKKLN